MQNNISNWKELSWYSAAFPLGGASTGSVPLCSEAAGYRVPLQRAFVENSIGLQICVPRVFLGLQLKLSYYGTCCTRVKQSNMVLRHVVADRVKLASTCSFTFGGLAMALEWGLGVKHSPLAVFSCTLGTKR